MYTRTINKNKKKKPFQKKQTGQNVQNVRGVGFIKKKLSTFATFRTGVLDMDPRPIRQKQDGGFGLSGLRRTGKVKKTKKGFCFFPYDSTQFMGTIPKSRRAKMFKM